MRYLLIALLIVITSGCQSEAAKQEALDREIQKVTSAEEFPSAVQEQQVYSQSVTTDESTEDTSWNQTEDAYESTYEEEGLLYDPEGPDVDCPDFPSHYEAQEFFIAAGGPAYDPHRLDRDNDGLACEAN